MSAVITNSSASKIALKVGFELNPVTIFKRWYDNSTKESSFQSHFIGRNDIKVITPFLDGLGAEYKLVHQLLFVRKTDDLTTKLKELGFKSADEVFAGMKWTGMPTSKHLKEITVRLYHNDYNIEVYLQPTESWSVVTSACTITDDLAKVNAIRVPETFLSVYDSLLTIMLGTKK